VSSFTPVWLDLLDTLALVWQLSQLSCSLVSPFSALLSLSLSLNLKPHLMLMHFTTVAIDTLAMEEDIVEVMDHPGFQARSRQSQSHSIITFVI